MYTQPLAVSQWQRCIITYTSVLFKRISFRSDASFLLCYLSNYYSILLLLVCHSSFWWTFMAIMLSYCYPWSKICQLLTHHGSWFLCDLGHESTGSWDSFACSPCVCVGIEWIHHFPPTIQKPGGRHIGYAKLSLGVSGCVNVCECCPVVDWCSIRVNSPTLCPVLPGLDPDQSLLKICKFSHKSISEVRHWYWAEFHFIPKVFSEVEVRDLCRPLKFFECVPILCNICKIIGQGSLLNGSSWVLWIDFFSCPKVVLPSLIRKHL